MKIENNVSKLEKTGDKFQIIGPTLHNTPALAMPDAVFIVIPDDIRT